MGSCSWADCPRARGGAPGGKGHLAHYPRRLATLITELLNVAIGISQEIAKDLPREPVGFSIHYRLSREGAAHCLRVRVCVSAKLPQIALSELSQSAASVRSDGWASLVSDGAP
jgi:hypothetical protein